MGLTKLRAEQISDIDYKQAVRVITVTDINLSGGAPNQVDGVNLSLSDRILVTAQDPGSENGLYQVETVGTGSNGTWVRTGDSNQDGELESGAIVMVTEGHAFADTQWKLVTNGEIIIGTTAIVFEQSTGDSFGNVYANGTAVLSNSVGSTLTLSVGNNIVMTGNNTSKTISISVADNIETNGNISATGTVYGRELFSTNSVANIGGTINMALPATNTDLITGVTLDVFQNRFRIFETGGNTRGGFFDLSTCNVGASTNFGAGGGGGGSPGGANTQVQFNDDATFAGSAGFTFNKLSNAVVIAGNITGAVLNGTSLTVSTGNVNCGNIVNNNANGVGNIGNSTGFFNTVFARATSAQYADLAEMYVADADYPPGTVVEFGGVYEVTITATSHSTRVAGIISTNPSYLMNASQTGNIVVPVALTGRVPCSVIGKIEKGDRLVSSHVSGVAQALNLTQYQPACIVGKALENYNSDLPGVIEVAVGRT